MLPSRDDIGRGEKSQRAPEQKSKSEVGRDAEVKGLINKGEEIPVMILVTVKAICRSPGQTVFQYAESEEQRLHWPNFGMKLGTQTLSLNLEIEAQADSRISEELLKSLFLQCLPTHVQQILAISNDQLDKLAIKMADGIIAVTKPYPFGS
ncbi:hypothetical protein TNCV_5087841 [Trichonephila clavipes]|nr:hypothetical protein TNCV_5087841 [Trichonephila clavipes]